jgi:hypothetical protein
VLPYVATDPVIGLFLALPILLSLALAWAVDIAWQRAGASRAAAKRAAVIALACAAAWMLATLALSMTSILRQWDRTPPPFLLLVIVIVALAIGIAWSELGTRLATNVPLWGLVAVQAFRLPLELDMHRLTALAIMPVQMSYSGRNFDIVTGATAIVVAALVATGRGGRALVIAWNIVGLALLANILAIAILSTPRFHYFGDGPQDLNVFVTYPPFIWLPAVMVLFALAGHLLIFRAARLQRSPRTATRVARV